MRNDFFFVFGNSLQRLLNRIKNLIPVRIKVQRLHVFYNETDTYIAFDLEDAEKAVFDTVGETRLEMEGESIINNPFKPVSDSTKISINIEPSDYRPFQNPLFAKIKHEKEGDYYIVSAPAWAWILENGRGMLCSTEY